MRKHTDSNDRSGIDSTPTVTGAIVVGAILTLIAIRIIFERK